jgi:hypothetical protein
MDEVLALALASQPVPLSEITQVNEVIANDVQAADKSVESKNTVVEAIKH